ncbi:MAG: hypothetical protein ACJ71Q_20460 [Terriglobales bacterium]
MITFVAIVDFARSFAPATTLIWDRRSKVAARFARWAIRAERTHK